MLLLIVVCLLPILLLADGLRFDGVDDWVDFTTVMGNTYSLTNPIDAEFTIDLWFNPHDMSVDFAGAIGDGTVGDKDAIVAINDIANSNLANHVLIFIWNNQLALHKGNVDGNDILHLFDASDYHQWHHLVLIYKNNANTISVYLDGSLIGDEIQSEYQQLSLIAATRPGDIRMSIGQEYDFELDNSTLKPSDFFEGGIDEIRVWNRSLSQAEITDLSIDSPSEAIGDLGASNDYVARFTMEGSSLTSIESSVDLNLPGTYVGTLNCYGLFMNNNTPGQGPLRFPHSDVSLPIELSSFTAKSVNGTVELAWTTESEINNAGFNLYKSEDDINYEKVNVSLIGGAINSSTPNSYSFTDTEVKVNAKYYFKLEDVSTSGETNLHGSVSVITTEKEAAATKFALGSAYPNPFNPSTTINFSLAEEAKVQINIYDMAGNLVNTLTNNDYATGNYNVVWNAVDFNSNPVSAGIYIYQMTTNTGFSQSEKMILVK